jgi:AraC family transcriptional regulator
VRLTARLEMKYLPTGHFFGETNRIFRLDGITLTDTEYTHANVDWHFHENAYFTFILHGKLIEGNRKESYNCTNGSLLFHSWQEPHYNVKPEGYTRGFHIEFDDAWFERFYLDKNKLEGSFKIENPDIKLLLYKIYRETKICDDAMLVSLQALLLETIAQLIRASEATTSKKPLWVNKLRELLHDHYAEKHTLENLSGELSIHPVHLSRDFSKYFHCTLGEYIRKIRIEKALSVLSNKNLSLTDIAFNCGFADQSHFLRCFKNINGATPSEYRKLLIN